MSRQYHQIGKGYKVADKEGKVFKLAIDLSITEFLTLLEKEEIQQAIKQIKTNRHEQERFIELSLTPLSPEYQNQKKQYILEIQIQKE